MTSLIHPLLIPVSLAFLVNLSHAAEPASTLRAGVAEEDITPPAGFPMAGYYHERLADGTIDPLKAKAIVLQNDNCSAALVVCDLVGIATDLSKAIRQQAAERTGIPADHIVVSATHSHTAPDYMKELYLHLGDEPQEPVREKYIEKLIRNPVEAIVRAHKTSEPVSLQAGSALQQTAVAFNRRFVMQDGSVRTWMKSASPGVIRAAGPVDPEIGLLMIRRTSDNMPRGLLSSFALHLDTVGGTRWSADYPYFIEQQLRASLGSDLISIFGTGCCGDINHADPDRSERNTADVIGRSLAESITSRIDQLSAVNSSELIVKTQTVLLPLRDAAEHDVERSVAILKLAAAGEKVDFYDHVTAYRTLILDQLRHPAPYATAINHLTWGLSRSLAGVGESLPTDVTVVTVGQDVAIVCLPGEVFVELGLAIKQASPFRTTLVIELSNCVETIYIPHRAAYAGGSYEVTNSAVLPGAGELLVETSLRLLREAAEQLHQ